MNPRRLFAFFLFLLIIGCSPSGHKTINDLIQPVNLEEGQTKEILISDLFYADEYKIKLIDNDNVIAQFDKDSLLLSLTPREGFSGLDLLKFKYDGNTYSIPFKLEKKQKRLFTFKPTGHPKHVNLFGQFNSWNRQSLPMTDKNEDGVYEIEIPLEPGRYEYKFFVDGKELIDNENPVKVPNGLGDYNSVLIVENPDIIKPYLHLINSSNEENTFRVKFFYFGPEKMMITKNKVVALLDNHEVKNSSINVDNNFVSISIPSEDLNGNQTLRVAVNSIGKTTDFQTILLAGGVPQSNESDFDWRDAIIYCIMIDRFNDGDSTNDSPIIHDSLFTPANYQGGDLQGIIDKIDDGYFDSLGINTFWISPIVDNTNNAYREYPAPHRYYTGYHGYWPVSLEGVEEHFGDMGLAKKLVDTAHKHGMKVLLDYVAHHVHIESPLWKNHRDWFGDLDLPDGRKNLRLWDEYRLTTWFEPYMPSFNYVKSKDALEIMTSNAVWWLRQTGADGFRHDAVKHVPNEFWRTLTRKLEERIEQPENKTIYQIGETFGGYDLISSYVNNGQLSAQFNFNLYDTAIPVFIKNDLSFELLDQQMQKTFSVYGVNHLMGNIMDSHDKIRFLAMADGDLDINDGKASEIAWDNPPVVDYPESYKKLQLYMAYMMSIPGIPVVYYGDEIGMTGASDPDNRRMMRFGNSVDELEKENLKSVSEIINLRKNHPALRYGDFYTLEANENIYAYIRSDLNERILVILNKKSEPVQIELLLPSVYNITEANNLLKEDDQPIIENKITVTVPSIGFLLYQLK